MKKFFTFLQSILPFWLIALAIVIACGGLIYLVLFGGSEKKAFFPKPISDIHVTVISGITSTPVPPTLTPTVTPTTTPDLSPTPAGIGVGRYVQILGTNGDGLRIRETPGLSGHVNFLTYDLEVYQIVDGSIEEDGFVWWKIVALHDESIYGWAVEDFLDLIESQ